MTTTTAPAPSAPLPVFVVAFESARGMTGSKRVRAASTGEALDRVMALPGMLTASIMRAV